MTVPQRLDNVHGGARPVRANAWLHRYCILLACFTLFLIVAGGMVTSTGSGLAVPDWPTTYGQNMFTYPPSKWVGGIFYEHGHRLIASTVGVMTIILAVWLRRADERRWMRRLGWIALAAVIAQGILGGLTVRYLLPAPISVFHGCLAQSFLCLVVSIAVFTSPRWRVPARAVGSTASWPAPRLCAMMTGAVFLQLILGAVMRHTESGLAVPDFPLAYGKVIPNLSASAVEQYNYDRRWTYRLEQVTVDQISFHLAHRAGAVLVAVLLMMTTITLLRRHGDIAALKWSAILAMALLAAQIGLGAWTVWSGKNPRITTAHVAVGASLLATVWFTTLMSYRFVRTARREPVPSGALAGVAG
ncbi:MAG: COX15/CtaA family protein [Planctomycetota bacterium]